MQASWSWVRTQFRQLHTVAKGLTQSSNINEAIKWLEQWDRGDYRDAYFYLLRRCIDNKALPEGRRLHSLIRRRRYDYDGFLGNLLIKFYGACNSTQEARQTFDSLPTNSSMISLNNMLLAYIQNDELHKAREFFDSCKNKDVQAWITLLTAYVEKGDMSSAKEFFKTAKDPAVELWATLIKGYAKSGRIDRARVVFKAAPRNGRLWTAMIEANAESGHFSEARQMLEKMRYPGIGSCKPLFDHYIETGNMREAQAVFNKMGDVSTAPWTKLLTAYLDHGHFSEARKVFRIMPNKESAAWNSMIRAASQRGDLQEATELFEEMGTERNLASWNAIMEAYATNGRPKDTLKIFKGMKQRYIKADKSSFKIIMQACTELEDAEKVLKELQWSLFLKDVELNNMMVKVLVKLGGLEQASNLFASLEAKEMDTWTWMVRGFANSGQCKPAAEFFTMLVSEGVTPGEEVFGSLVSACRHQGKLEEAREYFRCMVGDFDVIPTYRVYVCMVELVKKPSECLEFIQFMPYEPDREVWTIFLELCNKAGDQERVKVAERALSELRLEELRLEQADVSEKQRTAAGSSQSYNKRKSSKEDGERRARILELEHKARKSMQEERRKVAERVPHANEMENGGRGKLETSGMIMDTDVLRAKTMDLEKFWIGD